MFLFSTPAQRDVQTADPVVQAIRDGSRKTGVEFDYLLKTAQRESGLTPDAKARTSSATGLFQFIEQTWLAMVKQEGPKQGLSQYSDAIVAGSDGRLAVSDAAMREAILKLRNDPQTAAVMAGALTQKNSDQLAAGLGRTPHAGELYIAHVLGAKGATDLIRTAGEDPGRVAARDFPEAAAANRNIFFDKSGRARTSREVYGVLAASHAATQTATATRAAATAQPDQGDQPAEIAAGLQPGRTRGLIGLFSTEGSRAPVSKAVSNLWTTPRQGGERYASLDGGARWFPRATGTATATDATTDAGAASAAGATTLTAPLPPSRPTDLTQVAPAAVSSAKGRRGPLDLSSFMIQRNPT